MRNGSWNLAPRIPAEQRFSRKYRGREELIDRMHQRRERDMGTGYGSSSGYAAKTGSYVRAWRPGMFSFR